MSEWRGSAGRRERAVALTAVIGVHVAIGVIVLTSSSDEVRQSIERPLQLVNLKPPRAAPRPIARPTVAKPVARAPSPPAPKLAPTHAVAPRPLPIPVPVPARTDESATAGSAAIGLGSGAAGTGAGTAAGAGGLARHAEWIGGEITGRNYPEEAKRAGLQGVVEVRFTVRIDGYIRDCRVDRSSGSAQLDRLTCAYLEQRLLYAPARDSAGNAVEEMAGRRFTFVLRPRRG